MRLSKGGRVGLLAVGIVALLVGWFLWSVETETSALNFVTAEVDGGVQVWENEIDWAQTDVRIDHPEAKTPEALDAAGGVLVFTGTQSEADRYMAERHETSDNYLLEAFVLAVGAVLVILSLIPAQNPAGRGPRVHTDRS